jgi:hypothetical protein
MYFDFGGKESIWLRMNTETRKAADAIGMMCVEEKRTMDDILGGVIRLMAQGKLDSTIAQLIADTKQVEIPEGMTMPTMEALAGTL